MKHLFVYGTLRPGQSRAPCLEDAKDLGIGKTKGTLFILEGMGLPAAVFGGSNTLIGNVFEIPDDKYDSLVETLDYIEGFVPKFPEMSFYVRQFIDATVNGQTFNCVAYGINATKYKPYLKPEYAIPNGDFCSSEIAYGD